MFEEYKDVVSALEVSEMLKLSLPSIYDLLNSGEIPHKKYGTRYIVPKKSVIDYITAV